MGYVESILDSCNYGEQAGIPDHSSASPGKLLSPAEEGYRACPVASRIRVEIQAE